MRLRKEIGPIVGANLDPSHLMWMGADPLAAIDALGAAIHHAHAKDTFINKPVAALTSRLENGSLMDIPGAPGATSHWATATAKAGGAISATACAWWAMTAGCPSSMKM